MARSICSSYFTATLPYRPGAATTLPLCKESAHFISKNREVILSPILRFAELAEYRYDKGKRGWRPDLRFRATLGHGRWGRNLLCFLGCKYWQCRRYKAEGRQ